ncbi:uncharacterized protein B0P05DRAFT_590679 [Gilbertella persicaria]|uniref:Methyltransferase domain-containing protein n=1 Tax=Rhizopus stolonifer TaxID=4846 RepID=A0A367KSP4_RHIST|nr:uncharacterized protein B0P05DRAFT_590679 [Gilbertella persicaria]KAI8061517.1 hypothetical protein B0P05DRAFT_590679 [Gilbertella persicaria]RCI04872.1 hypothetical protein CU098_012313 [Rhizopus stolonifer]
MSKLHQDIQCLPLSVRLGFISVSLLTIYIVQLQIRFFTNDHYHKIASMSLYVIVGASMLCLVAWDQVRIPFMFMYSCFFKRIGHHGNDQQSRLESFYQDQAKIYDDSRGALLRGRKTMLKLCAAQLKEQIATGMMNKRPIWIDLGGGTGWNIETMNDSFPIDQFEQVILVDLTPSLCEVARERFANKGWKNVTVLCQDAASFQMPGLEGTLEGRVGLITVSYALSMMDYYYPVVDRIQSLLSPEGIVGVVDFYVSGRTNAPAEKWSPQQNRQCNWFTRHFWQAWFELDHINLTPGRRDYLEYKFGTIKSLNRRNHFIVPYLIQMPYYIWLGCSPARQNELSSLMEIPDDTDSVASGISNLSSFNSANSLLASRRRSSFSYQNKQWRLDYNPALACHTQFRSYIYAFTWEDPRVDLEYLNLSKDDVMFVITSAGDNALEYALQAQPKRIHCIDMNPCQNHLLELKLAGITCLEYTDFWRMFGDGNHPHFSTLLHDIISPHLSSYAFQYWSHNKDRFSYRFYKTGYSGLALSILEWWIRMQGLGKDIDAMTNATTIEEQTAIWNTKIRPAIFSPMIQKVLHNPMFMWNALGVPVNQMNMFLKECTTQEYIENTLDPIPSHSLFSNDQYFYYLCLKQRYSKNSCPSYLTKEGFEKLKSSGALQSFRLHTQSILDALRSMSDGYLTRLVVMDHMDWFDPESCQELNEEIMEMKRALQSGGQVYWRSAGTKPWYNTLFVKHGFKVEPLGIRQPGKAIDRVNMYASFYRAVKP